MSTTTGSAPKTRIRDLDPSAKRKVRAAWYGMWLDLYDIYLPIVALTPAMMYFEPEGLSVAERLLINNFVFVLTLIGRPLGSIMFGVLADRFGRKRITEISVVGFSACTLLIGALPGYATIGIAALVLLLALRAIGGVFMGGEYTGANPLAMEATPRSMRGLVGGVIQSGYPLAYVSVSALVAVLLLVLPSGGLGDAYTTWGWRIPFIVGGVLGFVFFVHLRRGVEESQVWKESVRSKTKEKSPLRAVFVGESGRALAQTLLLMTGLWFGVQALTAATPTLLMNVLEMDSQQVTVALLIANLILAASYVLLGRLGQRVGRKRLLLWGGVVALVVGTPFYYLMVQSATSLNIVLVTITATVALVVVVGVFGLVPTYLTERFPAEVRSTGYGIGYSLALVIPSGYGYYMNWLSGFMPFEYTPLVLIVLGGVLTVIGATMGPDTRHVRMNDEE